MMKHELDFELIVLWSSNPPANLRPVENPDYHTIDLTAGQTQSMTSKSGALSIYDCLSWFSSEETLTGNDKWYCPRCKQHQNALKKMEVYRSPEFLIVHLKRFSHSRHSFFSSRKIGELIDFPAEGDTLDLTQYVLSNKKGEKLHYDLYAVSNHFGSLNGGHYTAYCQNPIDKKWYDCDDSDVSRMNGSNAVTKAAYVLFYRRRPTTGKR